MATFLLALDQSTACTGWALFENGMLKEWGKVDPNGEYLERIVSLRKWLIEQLEKYKVDNKFNIEVAIEEIQLQQIPGTDRDGNIQTFKKLAHVQGVLLELLTEMGVKYDVVSASSWKSSCGIKGKNREEQKRDAQRYVLEEFGIKAIQDTVDAICIGKHIVIQGSKVINWE